MQRVAVGVPVGTLGGPPVAGARQDHDGSDGLR
jgi:hypothetical protein